MRTPEKGDVLEIYWLDICASSALGSGEAEAIVRRTLGYYAGWKWQEHGGKRIRVRVFVPTKDGPGIVDSSGWIAIPHQNLLLWRMLEKKDANEDAFRAWSTGGGRRRAKGAK